MPRPAPVVAALVLISLFSSVSAADDPTGTWKWTLPYLGRTFHVSAKLEFKEGKLSGVYTGRGMDSPIEDASYADGKITFAITREYGGSKYRTKYTGTQTGDTLTGTVEVERNGTKNSSEWEAKRDKETKE